MNYDAHERNCPPRRTQALAVSGACRRSSGRIAATLVAVCALCSAEANDRRFSYSYEPETMPQGAMEFEQWVTLRTQRTKQVGRENFNRWDLREELEYGVTDNYTVGLYLNGRHQSYRNPGTGTDEAKFSFEGVSLENRLMVLNPATQPVGLTLYLEPTYSGEKAALEQKIILGQRHGAWKWAVNLIHETEWEHNFHETVGELEFTAGLARNVGKRWAVGVEVRDHNKLPEYERWANTAVFVGPVVSYRQAKWWAVLTVLPQVYGANYGGDRDGHRHLDLSDHERLNVRLLLGFDL